jgi:hypothetical protein
MKMYKNENEMKKSLVKTQFIMYLSKGIKQAYSNQKNI